MKEHYALIGTTRALREKGYAVFVTVTDVKEAYGQLRLQVTPVSGIGTLWVDASRTTPLEPVTYECPTHGRTSPRSGLICCPDAH